MVHARRVKTQGQKAESEEANSDPQNVAVDGLKDIIQKSADVFSEVEDYAFIILDSKGQIRSWNRGAELIKGYTPHKILGRHYRIFYSADDRQAGIPEQLLSDASTQGRVNYEGWRIRKDGSRFWGSMTLTALRNNDGSIRGFLKITRDLTDKKIAEEHHGNFIEELKMKNEELKKSEERYHKMVNEVLDYAIILLDRDGKVRDWNRGAENVKGYKPEEIIGKHFRLFYPKEEKERKLPERLLAEAVEKGSVVHEGWRIRKDGSRFWGSIVITALHADNGDVIGFSKVTRDLTQRKIAEDKVNNILEELRQANEQLKLSEERYHRMIDEVQDYAILLLNVNGEIENWNAGAQVIKGYQAKEIIGKHFSIFYTPEDQQKKLPETLMDEARSKGKVVHEGWRVRKDGSRFWGSVVITALHNTEGDVIGFSKVTRDLTDKKKAEDLLKASAAQLDLKNKSLERLNEELSSFTYVASHDLKEPLRKIRSFAARIEKDDFSPEKSRELLSKIVSSAARMQSLIEDLLAYSQVSNGEEKNLERVDLNSVLSIVRNDLEVVISEKQATINLQKLPEIMGVSFQLQQLFLNLLSNALKFSKPLEAPVISITTETIQCPDIPGEPEGEKNLYHHIAVTDNGIGFEPEFSDRIFEVFQRLHSKSSFAGSGIGLAIAKKVMENHNGVVSAESEPGVGATFHLYFPVTVK